ncbi:hypothetical protein A0J48_021815 [Sphaerospermopsis aphanizomenoides BCCUSP55]|nr:hypothetical protein [Sphaerospermopsis aphanizomenoides BCCUSP55]
MFKLSKFISGNLASLTLCSIFIGILSKPVISGEPIMDRNCGLNERTNENFKKLTPQNRGYIWLTKDFKFNNQKYYLQVYRFPDHTGVFCLGIVNKHLPKRLINAEILQNKLIEKVDRDTSQQNHYIVTVKGNKNEDFLRTTYRLNLSNPQNPKVTPIIKVYKK